MKNNDLSVSLPTCPVNTDKFLREPVCSGMAIPVIRNDWTGAGQNNILFLNGIPAAGKIGTGS